jgi:hypothetical protein
MLRFLLVSIFIIFVAVPVAGLAQTTQTPQPAIGTVQGTVKGSGGAPVAGAQVTLSGPARYSATTDSQGSFSFSVQPGVYNLSVTKGGYVPATENDLAIFSGESVPLQIVLTVADLSSLRTIASVSTGPRGSSINTGAAAISYLPAAAVQDLANPQINDVLQHLPDVTIQRIGSQPDTTIVLGGVQPYETQVLIDGHPLSLGEYGVWLSEYFSSFMLGGVETQVGPGNTTPFAATAVGGTANLLTPEYTAQPTANFVIGSDTYGSQYSNFLTTGSVSKLSYVFGVGRGSNNGPFLNQTKCVVNPNDSGADNQPGAIGTVQFCGNSSGSLFTKGEILKLKYGFSSATSFELGFLGDQGGFLPQGTSYGQFLGMTTIVSCLPGNPLSCNNPHNSSLVGQTIPAYAWYPGSNVEYNQPIFTGQFRTSIGNDTLLLRPYAGNIEQILDGAHEDRYPLYFSPSGTAPSADPTFENCTSTTTTCNPFEVGCYETFIGQILGYNKTPTVVNGQEECYQTQFSEFEQDKLFGSTLTYLHPVGDNLFSFNYDFHNDNSYGYYNADVPADVTVPDTTERYQTASLIGDLRATRTLGVKVGLYESSWSVTGSQNVTPYATPNPVSGLVPQIPLHRTISRFDPHVALTYQPTSRISYRVAFGTSATFPFAGYLSGAPFYTPPSATSSTIAPFGFVTFKEPYLNPETAAEFSLGMDMRVVPNGIFRVDLLDTNITNVFEQLVTPTAIAWPNTAGPAATVQPTNAARLDVQSATVGYYYIPRVGLGYNASMAFERSVVSGIPLQFYALGPSLPANDQQTCGFGEATPGSTTCIPYMKGYFQVTYASPKGTYVGLGADFEGKNNVYFQPPFLQFDLTLKQPIIPSVEAQLTVQNLLNTNNFYYLPMPNAGVTTTTGYAPGPAGGPFNYLQTTVPSTLVPAPPRTLRFQLRWHTGRP